jgi:anti-sigma regulatory factor (Ser/Thr protein kinase)
MRELALHILDIVENAITVGAKHIDLTIVEDMGADCLTIRVQDDGCGMDAETIQKARDPFYTTRKTRHVGLGIPLFAAAAERCAGGLTIESTPGQGTILTATFQHSHIDRAPLGDMAQTLLGILMRDQAFDLHYLHQIKSPCAEHTFEFDTIEIKHELGDLPLTYPDVRDWLAEFIREGEQIITCKT